MSDPTTPPPRPWTRKILEDKVLEIASRLDPGDDSPEAGQIRAAAQSIREHRESRRQS